MNINHIRYALEISRCGSINRAAKHLYVSQSSLSRSIKELESQINIKIFERSASGIITTHQGEEFLNHAAKLEEQCKHLEDLYFNGQKPNVFHLSVSSVRYAIAARAVINLYNRHKENPFQNICFEESSNEDVMDHVYDGLYNLGILIYSSEKRDYWQVSATSRNMELVVLATQSTYVFMGRHHPLVKEKSIDLEKLADYPHATMAQSDVSSINYCAGVKAYDFRTVAKRILVSDRAALYDILRDTNAYYLGLNLSDTSKCTTDICFMPIRDADVTMDCALVYLKSRVLTDAENEFISEMRALLARATPAEEPDPIQESPCK